MSSAVRNFLVMFFLFLLIFGICGHYFATELVPGFISANDKTSDTESTPADTPSDALNDFDSNAESEPEIVGDTYTFAFLSLGLENELMHIYLMHFNEGYETCVSASIPGDSTTETGGSTLEEIYRHRGVDFLLTKLKYLVGYEIDDYATLYSDKDNHSIVYLCKFLDYKVAVEEDFDYPNPDFEEYVEPEPDLDEESEESTEEESNDAESRPNEFITIEAGNYYLSNITSGIINYNIFLDTEWNKNARNIYGNLMERIFNDGSIRNDEELQSSVMNYMRDTSYNEYKDSEASTFLFKYKNQHIDHKCQRISDWDDLKDIFASKEKGA